MHTTLVSLRRRILEQMRHNPEQPSAKGLINPGVGASTVTLERVLPSADLAEVVAHVWIPRWSMAPGEDVTQHVLQFPATNLVVDADSCDLHGVVDHLSMRTLSGTGWAIGAMLRPGAGRAILGRSARDILNGRYPLTDPASLDLAADIRRHSVDTARCVDALEGWLRRRPGLWDTETVRERALVNRIVDLARDDPDLLRVEALADAAHLSQRTLQRVLRDHLGVSPKWVVQRFRLQEAAHLLRSEHPPALADLAAILGYADHAHFTRDFTAVVGESPHDYRAQNYPTTPNAPANRK